MAYHRARQWPEAGMRGGLMAACGLGAAAAEERLAKEGLALCVVACDNSPSSTTLSGLPRKPSPSTTDYRSRILCLSSGCDVEGRTHAQSARRTHSACQKWKN